ncbi:MAG: ribonuclease HII [Candidatus Babeliales bacterium]
MPTIKYKQRFNKDFFETQNWQENQLVCGIDEVGRGCLAGPVVTAAVILFPNKKSRLLKDSKLLDQEEREKGFAWIRKNAWFSYGIINHRDIDTYNIYHATLRAMKRTLMQLFAHCPNLPQKILVDAMPVNLEKTAYSNLEVIYFPFGERKSSSIAAASIVAKNIRDEIMRKLDPVFPHYKFARHKGYSTKVHQQAIREHGHSIIHRLRFLDNKYWLSDEQATLPFEKNDEHTLKIE